MTLPHLKEPPPSSGLIPGDVVTGSFGHHPPIILMEYLGLKYNSGTRLSNVTKYDLNEHWRALDGNGLAREYVIRYESFGRIVPLNRSIESVVADM